MSHSSSLVATRGLHGRPQPGRSRRTLLQRLTASTLAVPGLAVYIVGVLVPVGLAAYYSFTNYNILSHQGTFVGWDNYRRLIHDSEFLHDFWFTCLLTAGLLLLANAGGLTLALLLNRRGVVIKVLRTVTFIPVILSGVVIAYIWRVILSDAGVLNALLRTLHLSSWQTSWLGSARGAQLSVIVVSVWPVIGFCTVIFLAGLQSIPRELVEAAQMDGANSAQQLRSIVLPQLRPALAVTSTLLLITGFKSYDISVILTGGGPFGSSETAAQDVLQLGLSENRTGPASAAAMVLLLTVAILSALGNAISARTAT